MKLIAVLLLALALCAQNPNTAAFPSAVATDTTLPVANNLVRRTLNGGISSGATGFVVNTGSGTILAPVILQIDNEIFKCGSISTNTLSSCVGGQEGTSMANHSNGAPVVGYQTASQQNQAYAEIKAIEKALADRKLNAPAGGGTAQAQTVTLAPPLTAWTTGAQFCWIPAASNTAAAPTINPNSLGTKSVTKVGTTALVAGDILIGDAACVTYDGTEAVLQNPKTGAAGAYSSGTGINISGSVISADPAVVQTKAGSQLNPEHIVTLTSSSGSTLTGTMAPTLGAYADQQLIEFKWNQNCAGGAMTIAVDGLTATSLVKADGSTNLGTADCLNGQTNIFSYDGGLSKFKLMAGGSVASGSVSGTGTANKLTKWTGTSAIGDADLTGDCTTSGTVATTCRPGTTVPGTSVTLSGSSQIFVCTGTCTVTVPVPSLNVQYCVGNDDNVSTVITLSAIGSSARYENTARTAYGTAGTGTFVSSGAVGDAVCIVGRDSTHYLTWSSHGTWTAN